MNDVLAFHVGLKQAAVIASRTVNVFLHAHIDQSLGYESSLQFPRFEDSAGHVRSRIVSAQSLFQQSQAMRKRVVGKQVIMATIVGELTPGWLATLWGDRARSHALTVPLADYLVKTGVRDMSRARQSSGMTGGSNMAEDGFRFSALPAVL
jgi:hypothetical protein